MTRSIVLRAAPAVALALAACAGEPAAPTDPGGPTRPPPSTDLTIEWDGAETPWGEAVTLRARVADGVEGQEVEWVSLEDHYLEAPVVLGTGVELTTQALRPGITTVEARLLDGGGATVATATVDVQVSYRASWRMVQEGFVSYPDGTVADVWVSGGHAFVARRAAAGVSIVDLAAGPAEVGRYTAPTLFTQDVKVAAGIAYVSHEPGEGDQHPFSVTILDVSNPRAPQVIGGIPLAEVRTAHNVYIEGSVLAVASPGGGGVHLYDVSDPSSPTRIGVVQPAAGRAHDAHLRDGRLFGSFLPSSAGGGGLMIADVTAGGATVLSHIVYPGLFTHSAWLSSDGRVLYIADERVNAPIRIYDVSSPSDPRPLGVYQPRLGTIPHNFQVMDDRFAYLAHYKHGVEVVDVSDPANPRLIGFYDTHPGAANDDLLFGAAPTMDLRAAHEQDVFEGAWGVHWDDTGRIVVSDMQSGLFVFRYVGP